MHREEPYKFNAPISREIGGQIVASIVATIPSKDGSGKFFQFRVHDLIEHQIMDVRDRTVVKQSAQRLFRHATLRMGADRKRAFVREALQWIAPEQFAEAYLRAFPPSLTKGERDAMVRFLRRVGVSPDAIETGLKRFRTRPTPGRKHECYLFPASAW